MWGEAGEVSPSLWSEMEGGGWGVGGWVWRGGGRPELHTQPALVSPSSLQKRLPRRYHGCVKRAGDSLRAGVWGTSELHKSHELLQGLCKQARFRGAVLPGPHALSRIGSGKKPRDGDSVFCRCGRKEPPGLRLLAGENEPQGDGHTPELKNCTSPTPPSPSPPSPITPSLHPPLLSIDSD